MADPRKFTRKDCIIQGRADCNFVVATNARADGSAPFYELSAASEVDRHSALIETAATRTGVEARLIRAIMYMETTHGYYDAPLSWVGQNKSILPMNVNAAYWGTTFGSRSDLEKPAENIMAGAEMLKRISANLPPGASVREIATLYNNINATTATDYGARVESIYKSEPWKKPTAVKP